MSDAQQRLTEVQAAISDILKKGQRLKRGDRELYRAELSSLRLLEKQYVEDLAREQSIVKGRGRSRISYLGI